MKLRIRDEAGRSRYEAFVPLRLIERNMAFSIKKAMTVIAMPTSHRSTCRMKGLVEIVFGGALFIIRVSSLEGLRFATRNLLRVTQVTLPYAARNIHHRL